MAAAKKAASKSAKAAPKKAARKAPQLAREPAAWTPVDPAPQAWTLADPAPQSWTPATTGSGTDDRQYGLFLHLSALAGFIVGGFFFLGPLILWLVKKDQSAFIDRHGRAAMNFHISMVLYGIIAFVVFLIITIATFGIGALVLFPLIFVLALAAMVLLIVFSIIAGMKASQGLDYTYPLSIRFLKAPAQ